MRDSHLCAPYPKRNYPFIPCGAESVRVHVSCDACLLGWRSFHAGGSKRTRRPLPMHARLSSTLRSVLRKKTVAFCLCRPPVAREVRGMGGERGNYSWACVHGVNLSARFTAGCACTEDSNLCARTQNDLSLLPLWCTRCTVCMVRWTSGVARALKCCFKNQKSKRYFVF